MKLQRILAVDRQGERESGPRIPLFVVALDAIQCGVAASKVDAIQGNPYTRLKRVKQMCLNRIDRRLRKSVAAKEIGIVAEKCRAWSDLERPGPPSFGNAQFRLERPAIAAEVEQLGVVVLTKGRGNLQAHPNDKILLIAREVLCGQRRRPKQIEREAKPGIAHARHLPLSRQAIHKTLGIERRPRHDDIELGRLAGEIERSNVSQ